MRLLFLMIGVAVGMSEPIAAQTIPAESFADLQKLLRPGQQVIVRDQADRKQVGRFVSMTTYDILLEFAPRRQAEQRSFAEDAVSRVDIADSDLNGVLIGGGIGLAVTVYQTARCDDCDAAIVLFGGGVNVSVGVVIGGLVDHLMHKTVFASPRARHVHFEPLVGYSRAGIAARIHF